MPRAESPAELVDGSDQVSGTFDRRVYDADFKDEYAERGFSDEDGWQWYRRNFYPGEAQAWRAQGFEPAAAAEWHNAGFFGVIEAAEVRHTHPGMSAEEARGALRRSTSSANVPEVREGDTLTRVWVANGFFDRVERGGEFVGYRRVR